MYAGSILGRQCMGRCCPICQPFQPYRGKPVVRNDREGRGNFGIIRSPIRASILPDSHYRTLWRYSRGVNEAFFAEVSAWLA